MPEHMFRRVKFSGFAFLLLISALLFVFSPPFSSESLGATYTPKVQAVVNPPGVLPFRVKEEVPPKLTAQSALILEPESHTILWSNQAERKFPIASLTKMMTALVVFENCPLVKEVVVGEVESNGSQMGLRAGERVTIETLLWGMLLNSGNDATSTLARSFPGGEARLVELMNVKARRLSLEDTRFFNPVGWHDENHYSTARDLVHLAVYFLRQPFLKQIVSTKSKVVTSVLRDRWYHLNNTHPLLGRIAGVKGVKTGYTEEAGECLVTFVERGQRKLLVVVLGSKDREEDSRKLIEWAYSNWSW